VCRSRGSRVLFARAAAHRVRASCALSHALFHVSSTCCFAHCSVLIRTLFARCRAHYFVCQSHAVCASPLFIRAFAPRVWCARCRVLFRTWWRAGWRVIRARRARCFVYRQRAMSRVSTRRLHVVVLFYALRVSSRSANSSCLESLMLFNLFI
jgi:hypothetical protein